MSNATVGAGGEKVPPYELAPRFEHEVLRALVFEPAFFTRVGKHVEPDAFSAELNILLARACLSVSTDIGRCPASATVVVQRVARWREEGRVTHEQVMDVDDLLADLEAAPPSRDVDAVVREFAAVVKGRKRRESVHAALDKLGTRDSLEKVAQGMLEAERLGEPALTSVLALDQRAMDDVAAERITERLATGVWELDQELGGGPPAKTLNTVMGATGDGKSTFLIHAGVSAALEGEDVLIISLELSTHMQLCRVIANITGIPIKTVYSGTVDAEVQRRIDEVLGQEKYGHIEVVGMSAGTSRVDDVINAVDDLEQRRGSKCRVLVVDYADLLGHSCKDDYKGMREVYASLRDRYSLGRAAWCWTASANRRKQKKKEKQGVEDGSDSQHKARISDTWVVLDYNEETTLLTYYLSKVRYGKRGGIIELPTEMDCARIAPRVASYPSQDRVPF